MFFFNDIVFLICGSNIFESENSKSARESSKILSIYFLRTQCLANCFPFEFEKNTKEFLILNKIS